MALFLNFENEITDLILPYTDACIALYTQCFPSVCETLHNLRRETTNALYYFISITISLISNMEHGGRLPHQCGTDLYP